MFLFDFWEEEVLLCNFSCVCVLEKYILDECLYNVVKV